MTARNDDARRDADYDGMDALMSALVDDPLPAGARRDATFMAAHRAAAADVALLREQLLLIGETLTRDAGADTGAADAEPVAGAADAEPVTRAQARAGDGDSVGRGSGVGAADGSAETGAAGTGAAAGPGVGVPESESGAGAGGSAGRASAVGPADGSAATRAVGAAGGPSVVDAAADPSVRGLPLEAQGGQEGAGVVALAGRRRRPRALGTALRGLAAAAAATLVVGLGWLVVQSGAGTGDDAAGSSAADSAARPEHGDAAARLGNPGYLACARLVVEGTVAEVEAVPGTGQNRVTLDVDRSYKPAKGQDQVVFPMDAGIHPPLRPGDHVLVGIPRTHAEPDMWTTDEKEIARERAWINAALPESRTYPCEE